ncbi:hypothetical protein ACFLQL_02320 [Verrucomicrobiota bacterium]
MTKNELVETTNWVKQMSEDERKALISGVAIKHITEREIKYSEIDMCLIAIQYPSASIVGGFQQWKKAGHDINPGVNGIAIWVNEESIKPKMVMIFDISQTQKGYLDIAQVWSRSKDIVKEVN